jgi:hypothetical protein
MNVASLELCKELYELSGWEDTFWNYSRSSGSDFPFRLGHKGSIETREVKERYPAYDLGYLLRRLPAKRHRSTSRQSRYESLRLWKQVDDWVVGYSGIGYCSAESPEDAACELAIGLFKNGILTPTEHRKDKS